MSLNNPEPSPIDGQGPAIWDLVVNDLRQFTSICDSRPELNLLVIDFMCDDARVRDIQGEKKYGKRLRDQDGRDGLIDGYQEVMDLTVYLRKEIAQADRTAKPSVSLRVLYRSAILLWHDLRKVIYLRDGK